MADRNCGAADGRAAAGSEYECVNTRPSQSAIVFC